MTPGVELLASLRLDERLKDSLVESPRRQGNPLNAGTLAFGETGDFVSFSRLGICVRRSGRHLAAEHPVDNNEVSRRYGNSEDPPDQSHARCIVAGMRIVNGDAQPGIGCGS